jgi:hypothetical protein
MVSLDTSLKTHDGKLSTWSTFSSPSQKLLPLSISYAPLPTPVPIHIHPPAALSTTHSLYFPVSENSIIRAFRYRSFPSYGAKIPRKSLPCFATSISADQQRRSKIYPTPPVVRRIAVTVSGPHKTTGKNKISKAASTRASSSGHSESQLPKIELFRYNPIVEFCPAVDNCQLYTVIACLENGALARAPS